MTLQKIHHVGIAVRSIDQAMEFFHDQLGLSVVSRLTLPERGVHVAFLTVGESKVELLEPFSEDNPLGQFLERRGEGLHHVCFESDDLEREVDAKTILGAEFLDKTPRPGVDGPVVFMQPTCGVLVELTEQRRDDPSVEG